MTPPVTENDDGAALWKENLSVILSALALAPKLILAQELTPYVLVI